SMFSRDWSSDVCSSDLTLARAQPALAWREGGDGLEQVPVAVLQAGDRVRVGVGEAVPADGELETPASFDESLLTGESVPVPRQEIGRASCRERVEGHRV